MNREQMANIACLHNKVPIEWSDCNLDENDNYLWDYYSVFENYSQVLGTYYIPDNYTQSNFAPLIAVYNSEGSMILNTEERIEPKIVLDKVTALLERFKDD